MGIKLGINRLIMGEIGLFPITFSFLLLLN